MMIADIAGWVAPVATAIAAIMTAANLGARVTGWGFVVFLIGSLAWSAVGAATGQTNLLLTNGFLTLVNLLGVWRWLGRQARYEKCLLSSFLRGQAAVRKVLWGNRLGHFLAVARSCGFWCQVPHRRFAVESLRAPQRARSVCHLSGLPPARKQKRSRWAALLLSERLQVARPVSVARPCHRLLS